MKWSFATVGLIILGLIGIAVILLFQSLTTNNENDYYLLKEITEASMFDAIDYKTYRETGELRIKEKVFVESFTRRFAESTLFVGSTYKIFMYDIMEYPPKATIAIDTGIGKFTIYNDTSDYSVVNSLSGILEYNNFDFKSVGSNSIFYNDNSDNYSNSTGGYVKKYYVKEYYSFPGCNNNKKFSFNQKLNIPDVLNVKGGIIKNINAEVVDISPVKVTSDNIDVILNALLNREIDWSLDGIRDYANDSSIYALFDSSNYYDNITISNYSIKKNGDLFQLMWDAINNSDEKCKGKTVFVKSKIKWSYEIFE